MSKKVFRTTVPADGQWHSIELQGPILHVLTRNTHFVEIWFLHDTEQPKTMHDLVVVGTGLEIPEDANTYMGTALAPSGLVWHLFEKTGSVTEAPAKTA